MGRLRDRIMVVVLTIGVIVAALVASPLSGASPTTTPTTTTPTTTQPEGAESTEPTSAEVSRGDLTTDYELSGNVNYGDTWALPLQLEGVVTSNRGSGDVVDFGDVLIRVGNDPVFLIEGDTPMYRELSYQSDRLEGADVKQFQEFLIDAGYDYYGSLTADGTFGWITREAVEDWQEDLGVSETGKVAVTDIVFSPTPLRIDKVPRKGTTFDGLEVSKADPVVTVEVDEDERDKLPEDGKVKVELSDGTVKPGRIIAQERKIKEDGSVVWKTTIDVKGKMGSDESSVLVTVTVVEASDVLIVPIPALLAVAEGGFAVEVVDGSDTRLVPVEVTEVLDTQAAITGEIQPGDEVVVPS